MTGAVGANEAAFGTAQLSRDLSAEELRRAPIVASLDALLIVGLSEDEDEAFAEALRT